MKKISTLPADVKYPPCSTIIILSKNVVDTTTTIYQLKESLAALEEYMNLVNSNIELFNLRVKNGSKGSEREGRGQMISS